MSRALGQGFLRKWLALAILLGAFLTPGRATAVPGSHGDPDDTYWPVDIKTLTHADSSQFVTFTLESYDNFTFDHVPLVCWDMEFEQQNDVASVVVFEKDGVLKGHVLNSNSCDRGDEPDDKISDVTISKQGKTLTVSVHIAALSRAGLGNGTYYLYRVIVYEPWAFGGCCDVTDEAPDSGNEQIQHTLDGSANSSVFAAPFERSCSVTSNRFPIYNLAVASADPSSGSAQLEVFAHSGASWANGRAGMFARYVAPFKTTVRVTAVFRVSGDEEVVALDTDYTPFSQAEVNNALELEVVSADPMSPIRQIDETSIRRIDTSFFLDAETYDGKVIELWNDFSVDPATVPHLEICASLFTGAAVVVTGEAHAKWDLTIDEIRVELL